MTSFHRSTARRMVRVTVAAGAAAALFALSACGSDDVADTTAGAGSAAEGATSAAGSMADGASSGAGSMASEGTSAAGSMASEGTESAGSMASGATGEDGEAPAELSDADIAAAKETLADPNTLTVCTSLPYPPFEAQDVDGNIVGFDMDMMQFTADALGLEKTVIDTDWSGVQSGQAMKAKTCDIAAGAMTINDERKKAILFSEPYYDASQTLFTMTDSGIKSLQDLKGKRLGGQAGTTGLIYANEHADEVGYEVVEYQTIADETQGLLSKAVDAGIHDLPAVNEVVKQQAGKVALVENFDTGEQYGFGVALGNDALIKVANYALANAKADGAYQASFDKWIGATPGN